MTEMQKLFDSKSINVSAFARRIGVAPTTLYNVLSSDTPERTGVGVWIKISEGLGMTPEELYSTVIKEPPNA